MDRIKYNLFLDESGRFYEKENGIPAIVAGYLVCGDIVDGKWAHNFLNNHKRSNAKFNSINVDLFHSMEDTDDVKREYIVSLLEKVASDKINFVVFENARLLNVVKPELTYLNVFSEGVACLIRHLLTENPDSAISLNICAASRLDYAEFMKTDKPVSINVEEYKERLLEKIELQFAKLPVEERKRFSCSIKLDNALSNAALMIADAVCFAYRGGVPYFNASLLHRISLLPCNRYSVNRLPKWDELENYFYNYRVSDAIYLWYTNYTDEELMSLKEEFNKRIVSSIKKLGFKGRSLQYSILSYMIGALVDDRKFNVANMLLDNMRIDLFPLLESNGLADYDFFFDVMYYRLTVATHQGDTMMSQNCIDECRNLRKNIVVTTEKLDYFIGYRLREIEHLKNIYAFEEAVKELEILKVLQQNVATLMAHVNEESSLGVNIHSNTLARILGSRVLARAYNVKNKINEGWYELARDDSNAAIEQFTYDMDKNRQYQSRCLLECESGHVLEAYKWLALSYRISTVDKVENLFNSILGQGPNSGNIFGLMHYMNVMAAAVKSGNKNEKELGLAMFDALSKDKDILAKLMSVDEYPGFIIQWRIGSTMLRLGEYVKLNKSRDFYSQALKYSCDNKRNLTNFATGLAIQMEWLALSKHVQKDYIQRIEKLIGDIDFFKKTDAPATMKCYFDEWETLLGDLVNYIHESQIEKIELIKSIMMERAMSVPVL